MKTISFLMLILVLSVSSCKKDDSSSNPVGNGSIILDFDHRANGAAFSLGNNYANEAGEQLNFSLFDYYVSNFELIRTDGSVYTLPKDSCYFLIKSSDASTREVLLNNIPAGDYASVRFVIGVDSVKSVSPASERVGVLDPAGEGADMYWSWNSGYIFVKAEGTSPQISSVNNMFKYHIGLFGGGVNGQATTLNNLRQVTLSNASGDVGMVRSDATPEYHIMVDVMQLFKSPTTISVAANPTVMASPFSANVANNYTDMFVLDHIHN